VSGLGAVAVVLVAFVAMEGVSYAMHRFVMHGPGWTIHGDHHRPPRPGFERNDVYPASFSLVAVALYTVGTTVPGQRWALWAGIGMTAYGLAYLWAHEMCIHQRIPGRYGRGRYARWLRRMHRVHHLYGGEPYGMLLPIVPAALRRRAAGDEREPLARESTRSMRTRL
jgi:beta-carotene 3-hydroxylase